METTGVTNATLTPADLTEKNWFTELIARLRQVIMKLLIKFGFKLGL
ncbi:MAG: hypothetical protein NC122_07180 [Faecalibacterium sp.]|nr:hypothetical protein [Ruminococcus sp.]MCM1391536.1 hypothetical protein [Ruminococcus sp.]MCM1485974.1 hypothetical protein [Faecalibacterium sp.]